MILTLASLLGLAGCSAIKLGYNNLPDIAYWWLDGYVDFADEQQPAVRDALARLHAWHRRDELPRLADQLARMEKMAAGEVAPAQVCGVLTEVQARMQAVADRAEPAVLGLAASLQAKQLQHLQRKYRKNDEAYRREWIDITAAEQREKRFEQVVERSEMIYGRLDEPQRNMLRQALAQSSFDAKRLLAERERRQKDMLQTLGKVTDPATPAAEVRLLMRAYLERAVQSPDLAYRRYQEALLQESCRQFSLVHASTTPAQRDQAARRLRAYEKDLRELAQVR